MIRLTLIPKRRTDDRMDILLPVDAIMRVSDCPEGSKIHLTPKYWTITNEYIFVEEPLEEIQRRVIEARGQRDAIALSICEDWKGAKEG